MSRDLEWRQNAAGKWAWFEGQRQVTGAYPDEAEQAYALRVHGLEPVGETPSAEVAISDHPEYARLLERYGRLSLAELNALAESLQAQAREALAQHVHEFDGRGGRRYGAAMATQAGREIAAERLLLCAFCDLRAAEVAP